MTIRKAKKLGNRRPGHEALGALAEEAQGAADRAGAALDDALAFVAASEQRITSMEAEAQKKEHQQGLDKRQFSQH